MERQPDHINLMEYVTKPEGKTGGEVEPRVITEDVARLVRRKVRPDDDDVGSSVALVAEKADTSTRTVYRVLSESTPTISLDLADRLCIAADSHLAACRLSWPDGHTGPYIDAEFAAIMAG
jgi:hypothetical protein